MARGFISGALWGVVVAGGSAAGLSLAYPDFTPGKTAVIMDAAEQTEMAVPAETPAPEAEDTTVASEMTEMAEDAAPEEAAVVEPEPMGTDQMADTPEDMPAEVMDPTADDSMSETAMVETAPMASEDPETDMVPEETDAPATDAATSETASDTAAEQDIVMSETAEDTSGDAADTEISSAMPALAARIAEIQNEQSSQAPDEAQPDVMMETEEPEAPVVTALAVPAPTVPVQSDRLPSISDSASPAAPQVETPRPFDTYSANFEAAGDKPLMAIVLLDDQGGTLGPETLETFPYPLTFAIDASRPGAADRMALYRAKGFEVLALVDLPRGAAPSDVEVAMSAYLAAVPEAVGIIEGTTTGVQTSRDVTDQLTQILIESGHGLLLQPSGLNTAQKLAAREGVPSGTIFRDFDGNGQSASVMRRFLDQAAFRAGQEGGVVMMGRLQAETISALLIWGLADRASRVSLVPATTLLKAKQAR